MSIIYCIFISSFITFVLYLLYNSVKDTRKNITTASKIKKLMEERVKNWKPIFPPPEEKYIIVRAKELENKNIIIHLGSRFEIYACGQGVGAGSYEFGEYVWIKGSFVNSNPTDLYPVKDFWLYQESPIIKCI